MSLPTQFSCESETDGRRSGLHRNLNWGRTAQKAIWLTERATNHSLFVWAPCFVVSKIQISLCNNMCPYNNKPMCVSASSNTLCLCCVRQTLLKNVSLILINITVIHLKNSSFLFHCAVLVSHLSFWPLMPIL